MVEKSGRIMIYVTGVAYEGRQKLLKKLYLRYSLGEKIVVKLEREPDNKFDKYAVKVLFNKKHIGYIPKKISKLLSGAIKKNMVKKTSIYDIHITGDNYGASVMLTF